MKKTSKIRTLALLVTAQFIIPVAANYLGVMSSHIMEFVFNHPQFDDTVAKLTPQTHLVMAVSFLLAIILISLYNAPMIRDTVKGGGYSSISKKLLINSPLAYGTISVIGWLTAFAMQALTCSRICLALPPKIVILLFLEMFFSGIVCMTAIYYATELFNRRFLIPIFFPDGKIYRSAGRTLITIRSKFIFFFISTILYPCLLFMLLAYNIIFHGVKSGDTYRYITALGAWFIISGLAITLLISSFFQTPLEELERVTRRIRKGDYTARADVRSADQIGMLGETINDMCAGLQEKEAAEERARKAEMEKAILEEEILLAQKIQFALLPGRLPATKTAAVAYKYVPMLGIGGDFVDIYHRPDAGIMGMFICDVSGHGISAALMATMVKMSLSTWGETLDRPSDTLMNIQNSMSGKLGNNFITAGISFIDLKTGRLVYSSAGHPPALILRSGGDVEVINPRGRFISELPAARFEETESELRPGDKMVLYTDGVIEARKGAVMLGDSGFHDLIREHTAKTPEAICGKVYDYVSGYTEGGLEDDFTIMVLSMTGNQLPLETAVM